MNSSCMIFVLILIPPFAIAFVSDRRLSKYTPSHRSTLFSTSDAYSIATSIDSAALEKAQQLRDKAKALRFEANSAEQALRNITQQR